MDKRQILTLILIVIFISGSSWLAVRTLQIQRAGEAGIPLGNMPDLQLQEAVENLANQPELDVALQLLPRVRAAYEKRDGELERTLLAIVLYYCANLDRENYHAYIKEALPLIMDNYSSGSVSLAGSGDLLLNFLAMSMQEDEFSSWKRDLLSREPYMADDLDLLALTLWLETDRKDELHAFLNRYISADLQSESSRAMAFKIHCMLNQYDQASKFESAVIDNSPESNSPKNENNDPEKLPVIDRWTYLTTVSYLLRNARFEEAEVYIDTHRNELLDPAYIHLQKAIILAADGMFAGPQFQQHIQQVVQSPYSDMGSAEAEASVYAELTRIMRSDSWLLPAAFLYTGNETNSGYLAQLSYLLLYSGHGEVTVKDLNGSLHKYSAVQLAMQAMQSASTFEERQRSLMMLAIVAAAEPDSRWNRQLQELSSGYLRKALLSETEDSVEGFPLSMRVDLAIITDNEYIQALRSASPAYDKDVHQIIRDYVMALDKSYGDDPLGLSD